MSYEKFIMDLDHCGMMMTLLQGFEVTEENFGQDAYLEAGIGENFLSTAHTLRHYATANFQPNVPEGGTFESWSEAGSPTLDQRANGRWKQMLRDYQAPEMDGTIRTELNEFVAERKNAMPDAWY